MHPLASNTIAVSLAGLGWALWLVERFGAKSSRPDPVRWAGEKREEVGEGGAGSARGTARAQFGMLEVWKWLTFHKSPDQAVRARGLN